VRLDPTALLALAAVLVGASVYAHRVYTRGVFVLTVRGGAVRAVRGSIPPAVLGDLREVLAGSGATGTVRALDHGGRTAVIELQGDFSPQVAQRVRNVVGNVPLPRLRAGG
jgi:hypothetical protein